MQGMRDARMRVRSGVRSRANACGGALQRRGRGGLRAQYTRPSRASRNAWGGEVRCASKTPTRGRNAESGMRKVGCEMRTSSAGCGVSAMRTARAAMEPLEPQGCGFRGARGPMRFRDGCDARQRRGMREATTRRRARPPSPGCTASTSFWLMHAVVRLKSTDGSAAAGCERTGGPLRSMTGCVCGVPMSTQWRTPIRFTRKGRRGCVHGWARTLLASAGRGQRGVRTRGGRDIELVCLKEGDAGCGMGAHLLLQGCGRERAWSEERGALLAAGARGEGMCGSGRCAPCPAIRGRGCGRGIWGRVRARRQDGRAAGTVARGGRTGVVWKHAASRGRCSVEGEDEWVRRRLQSLGGVRERTAERGASAQRG
ncbi:hypothetical protein DFH09DRAFT_1158829 [Mycena vulgaris]|nr:hypothetical protein DFH09DRAFT_1158829 [Mycena vulgaris]